MKRKKTADKENIQSLIAMIDKLEDCTGVIYPSWMALDALASSCADHDMTVRKCCRRHMQSDGLLTSHYLTLNNRIIVTCSTKTASAPGHTCKDTNQKTYGAYKKVSKKRYRNALIEIFVLQGSKHENR